MTPRTRIKICCIASAEEAGLAVAAGADALGLVARMPSGPGPIPDHAIAEIAASAPPPVATFLLTSETEPDTVVDHVRRCGTNTVQLVDAVPLETYAALRDRCPAVKIVQVLHVIDDGTLEEARAVAPHVHALLLDSGRPNAAVKELGGTGRVHDWSVSRRIVAEAGKPVFLAGGLRPDNVAQAIASVRPYGVDLCSGVRTDGVLDATKLAAFVAAVGAAP
jgi:phosphoribosylanthranilate isomerase